MPNERHWGISRQVILRVALSILFLIAVLVFAIMAIIFQAIENQPLIASVASISGHQATSARTLVSETLDSMSNAGRGARFRFREAELNTLAALTQRATGRLRSRFDIDSNGLRLFVTATLPNNPIGGYANIRLVLLPSPDGVKISYIQFGDLKICGKLIQPLLLWAVNVATKNEVGVFYYAIRRVAMRSEQISVFLDPVPDAANRLERIRTRLGIYRDHISPIDRELVSHYYGFLKTELSRKNRARPISLAEFIPPLFREVIRHSNSLSPGAHNGAALTAAALLFGSHHFGHIIGSIEIGEAITPDRITLADRDDLRLHFVISAGLRILSSQSISFAIGEFKELLDSDNGSGFSFADLAADRAGVKLADRALATASASQIQQRLSLAHAEQFFFPPIHGLEEGISKARLEREYGGIMGAVYLKVVAEIDRRIATLPLHR